MDQRPRGLLSVLVCSVLAGCGTSGAGRRVTPVRSTARTVSAVHRCAGAARLSSGMALPGWHMGAVQFLSAASGVGITATSVSCSEPTRAGAQVGLRRQSVRVAVTGDGGRSWQVAGTSAPVGPVGDGAVAEQIAAASPADLWAVVGAGRLVATRDGGTRWRLEPVPRPVTEVATADGVVWAVSCPRVTSRTSPLGCTPQLWRTGTASDAWTRIALPRTTAQNPFTVRLAITSDDLMVALADASAHPGGELLSSDDGGRHWTRRPAPDWDHHPCETVAGLTARGPRTFWLLCLGGAAAGASTKGLMRSTDAGATWRTVSAVTSLTERPRAGSIPLAEPGALAAGSPTRLWLTLTNGLAESNDGGRRWTGVPQAFDPGGWPTAIDVLDGDHAWVLASGAGLWRTTDGLDWRADGPLNTG